ncbi:MAG TPA: galactose-1-phosphate uridylyltransferase [Bryobacteraceae bacterium]|nr:galactose-1-phosphate uridylyltransferase [Bryobacteraceae bacterium]
MPELRKDPVTGRWVIIASDRAMRPTDFVREQVIPKGGRFCPFCPGNEQKTPPEVLAFRPHGGGRNEGGWTLRVVPNKFPALRVEGELNRQGEGIYDHMNGVGAHEVIIETPDHLLTFGELSEKQVEDVFWAFRERVLDLKKDRRLIYILIFKNHGEAAGASLEHTHSQLIALPVVPKRVREELDGAKRYFDFKERCIFCDIVRQELDTGPRVVLETEHYVVVSPYAPRFPFETWVVPKRHYSHFEDIETSSIQNLGWVMRATIRKIDKVLERPPYNLMIHSAPIQEGAMTHYHWHIEIIPKLTKVAGFEWGTGFYINPTPPETAAKFLRDAGLV